MLWGILFPAEAVSYHMPRAMLNYVTCSVVVWTCIWGKQSNDIVAITYRDRSTQVTSSAFFVPFNMPLRRPMEVSNMIWGSKLSLGEHHLLVLHVVVIIWWYRTLEHHTIPMTNDHICVNMYSICRSTRKEKQTGIYSQARACAWCGYARLVCSSLVDSARSSTVSYQHQYRDDQWGCVCEHSAATCPPPPTRRMQRDWEYCICTAIKWFAESQTRCARNGHYALLVWRGHTFVWIIIIYLMHLCNTPPMLSTSHWSTWRSYTNTWSEIQDGFKMKW